MSPRYYGGIAIWIASSVTSSIRDLVMLRRIRIPNTYELVSIVAIGFVLQRIFTFFFSYVVSY